MKFLTHLEKQKSTWFLITISFIFFILRLPSVFEPYWYGDEGIYEVIGMALRHGRHLYSGIWDNKPPLLYFIYAMFNGDQPSVRFFSLLFGLASVVTFFYLSKKLFQNFQVQSIITSIFAFLFATPFLEGNIANAENFMILPILLAALLVITEIQHQHSGKKTLISFHLPYAISHKLFIAGLLLGITFLIKIVAVFDFGAFFVFLFITNYKNLSSIRKQLEKLFVFIIGFTLPLVITFLLFFIQGDLKVFITSAFLSNIGYVEYGNKFFIPHGLLILKILLLFLFIILLFFKRRVLSYGNLFILLWTSFSLFDAFFSQRPYTHYILTFLTGFSLYIGMCIASKKLQPLFVSLLLSIILLITVSFSLHQRFYKYLFGYYGNFLAFSLQQRRVHDYLSFFDPSTARDYELASFFATQRKDTNGLFIWGNSAQIYKLTNTLPPGRFIVTYHMSMSAQNLQETGTAFALVKPKYIMILPKQQTIPYSLIHYQPKITIDNTFIYEKVF